MDYNSRKLIGYNTGSVYIPQRIINKMRKLPLYIRTVKGKGKRKRKNCRRCKRKRLRGGKLTKKQVNDHFLQSFIGFDPDILKKSSWKL